MSVEDARGDRLSLLREAESDIARSEWRAAKRSVLPGALMGAVIIQTIENGLVIINADPYLYPMATSAIIFVAITLKAIGR